MYSLENYLLLYFRIFFHFGKHYEFHWYVHFPSEQKIKNERGQRNNFMHWQKREGHKLSTYKRRWQKGIFSLLNRDTCFTFLSLSLPLPPSMFSFLEKTPVQSTFTTRSGTIIQIWYRAKKNFKGSTFLKMRSLLQIYASPSAPRHPVYVYAAQGVSSFLRPLWIPPN